jgi:SnoaL-like protein
MSTSTDELEIRRLVENWVVWRDAGDWERFRTVWHDDGRMMATWFQGSCDDFIRVSREGFERGVRILHFLGGTSVEVSGSRAVSQAKMTITQRADVESVECDVVCTGRFVDFLERRDDRWGIVLRQPIYESDRIIPVDPAAPPQLDRTLLESFPVGYRHLAYLQTRNGFAVKPDMPGLTGPEVEALYASCAKWLSGESLDR